MNCSLPERKLQTNIPHLIIDNNNDNNNNSNTSFKPYHLEVKQLKSILLPNTSPSVSPFPSPIIRPISSPMTPITPLVLTESHYQKEFMHFPSSSSTNNYFHDSKKQYEQYGYFQPYQNSHRYLQTSTQPTSSSSSSSSFFPNSPSPLSSGASTPTNLNNDSNDARSSHSSHFNAMNSDDGDNLLLPSNSNYNTFLHRPPPTGFIPPPTVVEIVNFDAENGGEIFKDTIISNSQYLNNNYYYEQNDEYQQKSHFAYNVNGINSGINGVGVGVGVSRIDECNEEIKDDRDIHNNISFNMFNENNIKNIMKNESNNNRILPTLTTLTHDDIQFHEILQGMNNMDI